MAGCVCMSELFVAGIAFDIRLLLDLDLVPVNTQIRA